MKSLYTNHNILKNEELSSYQPLDGINQELALHQTHLKCAHQNKVLGVRGREEPPRPSSSSNCFTREPFGNDSSRNITEEATLEWN